jgi:transposase
VGHGRIVERVLAEHLDERRLSGLVQIGVDEILLPASIDMSGGYEKAIRTAIPHAEVAFDPFHVVKLAQRAVDQVRRDEWNAHERSHTPTGR